MFLHLQKGAKIYKIISNLKPFYCIICQLDSLFFFPLFCKITTRLIVVSRGIELMPFMLQRKTTARGSNQHISLVEGNIAITS